MQYCAPNCGSYFWKGVNTMMNDSISRQAAIDTIMSVKRTDNPKSVALLIMDLPSAQPEIIRCKDCKWSEKYVPMRKTYYCREARVYGRTEDDFCSRAERRKND